MSEIPDDKPVAWRLRIGSQNLWSYCETESDADFYIKQSGIAKFEKQPLYLRPAPTAKGEDNGTTG
jgi:hypothetical protein